MCYCVPTVNIKLLLVLCFCVDSPKVFYASLFIMFCTSCHCISSMGVELYYFSNSSDIVSMYFCCIPSALNCSISNLINFLLLTYTFLRSLHLNFTKTRYDVCRSPHRENFLRPMLYLNLVCMSI